MNDNLSLAISVNALNSKIEAVISSLNSGQKIIFDNKMKEHKEKFIKNNPEATEEHLEEIEKQFK
ncbi:hypothetical protein EG346_15900 [Chryseobacterium carnipullorum]|uniref:Uncharacterized protein n=1 Tax=Chryseobacterium carnipullorum TaxID=1124835 RepID=A0A376DTY2_CHRCU|nr:hypothetical protein [Chryseobacterium carnipullorum]AZA49569.1 hypothetical protein EG346_15900 [Chryseobacterium carnipullorum]AZA64467.1 hypothetical protein EG345_06920 [Chryseobacterium carnipullorum]STC94849.1 Uncharacterised protein [Chryseobacterium carnipullorum]